MFSKQKFDFALLVLLSALLPISRCAFASEEVLVTDAPVRKDNIQLGMMTNYRDTSGSFDPYGTYGAYPEGSSVWSVIQIYSIGYRFESPLEVGLTFANRYSESTFPTGSSQSKSFGSPSLSARYHVAINRETHLIFHSGFSTPFKFSNRRTAGDPSASMSSDGDLSAPVGAPMGGYTLRAGMGVSTTLRSVPMRFSVDANIMHAFSSTQPVMDGPNDGLTQTVQRGNQYSLSEGVGYSLSRHWLVSGGVRQAWSSNTYTDGEEMLGTASRLFSTDVGLTYVALVDWRVTASYDTQWPFYSFIVNQPYAPSVSMGLTYTGLY